VPEGHTIHRLARHLRRDLTGHEVRAASPQGRFADGAALLDGGRIGGAEAWGKHLLVTWQSGAVLHVHLGLIGTFRRHPADADPRPSVRLHLGVPESGWWLIGPTVCEVGGPDLVDRVTAGLGPDPLRDAAGGVDEFTRLLARRRTPVAATLLDQKVVAGIGNVYRAELLFLAGIDPHRPAAAIGADEATLLWDLTCAQLATGTRLGRIVTRDPAEVGAPASRLRADERLYVYGRTGLPCRRCGTEVREAPVAGRRCWWCPTCQPGR
jgi:endonuclease VIII